jgi:hypothetical protein
MASGAIKTAEEAEALSLKYPDKYVGQGGINFNARFFLKQANGDLLVAEDMIHDELSADWPLGFRRWIIEVIRDMAS